MTSELRLDRADISVFLWHMALYGLASILETAGHRDVRVAWTHGMQPRPTVSGSAVSAAVVGDAVREHAVDHHQADSWVAADFTIDGRPRGLMSPRLKRLDSSAWEGFAGARRAVLDDETEHRAWLDLRMISALGEPAYWSEDRQGQVMQDDGASRMEMQPRNQGSEFVGNRLRKLAKIVADRTSDQITAGLVGQSVVDELGSDSASSSTPTGLANVGPTDNAVAWCALWGISSYPTALRAGVRDRRGVATTAGHLGTRSAEWFYAPVWHVPWSPARLRSVLASQELGDSASSGLALGPRNQRTANQIAASDAWLASRGVVGICRFPIRTFGSTSAPERRAMGADRRAVGAR